jgi:YaiO family outer membrane protein
MMYFRIRATAWVAIALSIFFSPGVVAQNSLSCDSLFHLARISAFNDHNYPAARSLCKEAMAQCPGYADIGVFLGRLYSWDHQPDSARPVLLAVIDKHPENEDALSALTDLEYWNGHSDSALVYCERCLAVHPSARDMRLKKIRILIDLKRYKEAAQFTDTLVRADPRDGELRSLSLQARSLAAKNQLGINYDHVHFDKQFDAPWELASIDYKRQTAFGAVIGRINYANRFRNNGLQAELDAYPHISRTFYGYLNVGYSGDVGVFPHYRAGMSLYANLPKAFEADAGFRYLYFSDATWIYTVSVGKYLKNWWFNLRSYLTPGRASTSQSYTLTTRYYYGGADDYFSLALGTGISPDDRSNNVQLNNVYPLRSNKLAAGFNHALNKMSIMFLTATWLNQEYLPDVHGNQLDIGIGFQKRF